MPCLVGLQLFVSSASSQRVSFIIKVEVPLRRYRFVTAALWRAVTVLLSSTSSYTRNNDNNRSSCDDQTDRQTDMLHRPLYVLFFIGAIGGIVALH